VIAWRIARVRRGHPFAAPLGPFRVSLALIAPFLPVPLHGVASEHLARELIYLAFAAGAAAGMAVLSALALATALRRQTMK
jgi:hypothetical protein